MRLGESWRRLTTPLFRDQSEAALAQPLQIRRTVLSQAGDNKRFTMSSKDGNKPGGESAGDRIPILPLPLPANVARLPSADRREKLRIVEALLFAAAEPLDEASLAKHLGAKDDVGQLLDELQILYAG